MLPVCLKLIAIAFLHLYLMVYGFWIYFQLHSPMKETPVRKDYTEVPPSGVSFPQLLMLRASDRCISPSVDPPSVRQSLFTCIWLPMQWRSLTSKEWYHRCHAQVTMLWTCTSSLTYITHSLTHDLHLFFAVTLPILYLFNVNVALEIDTYDSVLTKEWNHTLRSFSYSWRL